MPAVTDTFDIPAEPAALGLESGKSVPSERATPWPVLHDGRIPSLDGLRAVSIAAVLLGHMAGTTNFPPFLTGLVLHNGWVDLANLGVRVFFVISGFLITGILMSEHRRRGRISLRHFYLRRTMRIFPAYYAFLATAVVATIVGVFSLTANDVAHALTYTTNYDADRSWQVGHLWSLAVEEQFYLLWPLTIVLLGLARAPWAAIGVVLVAPLFRALEYRLVPGWVGNSFETTADAIAIGCLLALSFGSLMRFRGFRMAVDSKLVIAAVFAVALILGRWGVTNLLLSVSLLNVAAALLVAHVVLHWKGITGRFLNLRPIVFIGVLSYSIYLWQQVFLDRHTDSLLTAFPVNIGLAAFFALASYYLVERPFLRIRPRVEARVLGTR